VAERIAPPPLPGGIAAHVSRHYTYDGLAIEEISWQLPYGPPTQALVLKPAGAKGLLPAVLALHDHGRFKFLGKEKIAQTGPAMHPLVGYHRADAYEGLAWANELARRGYVVLVHDAFAFGSRRVRLADVPPELRGTMKDDARAVFLAGLDDRIRSAVCVGMMTTWRDFLLHKSYTHTWMCFVPLLPRDMDFPEILGLRAPLPALVMNTREDPLFTLSEMERAAAILAEVYSSSGAPEAFRASWYPGHHQFNRAMQAEAFAWFDRWLV
jgi:hypothetical protein